MARLDRLFLLAFGRHADAPRHAGMRRRYRSVGWGRSFDVALARLYALSWVAFAVGVGVGTEVAAALPPTVTRIAVEGLASLPFVSVDFVDRALGPLLALTLGGLTKRGTLRAADALLDERASRRRDRIERTLPRSVRYMHVVASGTTELRALLEHVASRERAFGETARAFRRVLTVATLTGTVDGAIRIVARDTPARRSLAPFLLTMRARAREGPESLARFLHLESRTLARHDAARTGTVKRYLGSVVRLFVIVLIVPVVAVIVGAVLTGLGESSRLPVVEIARWVRSQVLLSPVSAFVVLGLGTVATGLVYVLRPPEYRWSRYRSSNALGDLLATAHRNPANALVVAVPLGLAVGGWLWFDGTPLPTAGTLAYVSVTLPVGIVEFRRARLDAAKDRYLPAFLHEIAHQVHLGRSFAEAVDHVAAGERLGPLNPDVADLAVDLRVARNDRPVRAAALDRFVERVGTPLAERTVGMIAGALDAGSNTAAAFEALQSEGGRLYHEERAIRDEMPVVLAVGWVASLLVVGIVVTINVAALGTTVPGAPGVVAGGGSIRPAGPPVAYFVTQATVLASGWFAGVAGRGIYEGMLHSGALVLLTFLAFAGTGLV